MRLRAIPLVVLGVVAVTAGPAAAATPKAGVFAGETKAQGGPVVLTVARGGKRVTAVDVGVVGACLVSGGQQQYRHKFRGSFAIRGGKVVVSEPDGRFALDLTATFRSRTRASGSLSMSRGDCLSTKLKFTVARQK